MADKDAQEPFDMDDITSELEDIGRMLNDSVMSDSAYTYRLVLDWTGPQALAQSGSMVFATLLRLLRYGMPDAGRARMRMWENKNKVMDSNEGAGGIWSPD